MGLTKIEWADYSFNPWWGCARVSAGCDGCYAEAQAKRYGHDVWGKNGPRRELSDANWRKPLKWNADAEQAGTIARVFSGSMCDVFELHPALDPLRERLWQLIADTPWLIWMLLTKRPENVADMAPWGDAWPVNVWLGTTVESERVIGRIADLLAVPARLRFLSCEPLIGGVDLAPFLFGECRCLVPTFEGAGQHAPDCAVFVPRRDGIGWIIAGGESGPHARPPHPGWFRDLRNDAGAAGVPFLFKQWGEWRPPLPGEEFNTLHGQGGKPPAYLIDRSGNVHCTYDHLPEGANVTPVIRVGKKVAGRELDGRTWDELPDLAIAGARLDAMRPAGRPC